MGEPEKRMRGAAFGGFKRKDVLDYIKKHTDDYEQKLESMQELLDARGEELSDVRDELSSVKELFEADERDVAQLQRTVAEKEEHIASLRLELEASVSKGEAQSQEIAVLKAGIGRLQSSAQAYEQLKEKTAEIEFEAHKRALEIEQRAERDARAGREALEQCLVCLQKEYEAIREHVHHSVVRSSQDLTRVVGILQETAAQFEKQDESIAVLLEKYRKFSGCKPPAPSSIQS